MNKSFFAMAVSLTCLCGFAEDPYQLLKYEILNDIASTNREVRLNVTNRIGGLMTMAANSNELATCKLIKAKVLTECVDIMGEVYDGNAYGEITNLCYSVLRYSAPLPNIWQRYGAVFTLALPLSTDSQHQLMYTIATNALVDIDIPGELLVDTNVCTVLYGQQSVQPGYMKMALRTLAAVSLSLTDRTADVFSYTNGLPIQFLQMVNEVRVSGGN